VISSSHYCCSSSSNNYRTDLEENCGNERKLSKSSNGCQSCQGKRSTRCEDQGTQSEAPGSPAVMRGLEEKFVGNGSTPLHKTTKQRSRKSEKNVRYSTMAVVPCSGDGRLYRSVLIPPPPTVSSDDDNDDFSGSGGGLNNKKKKDDACPATTLCCTKYGHKGRSAAVVHPAEVVDQACRGLFPLGFLFCNVAYWIYYLHIATDDNE